MIRAKWPKSLSTYISNVKKQWMTLEKYSPDYAQSFVTALQEAQQCANKLPAKSSDKAALLKGIEAMHRFNELSLTEKNRVQRTSRVKSFTGHPKTDELLITLRLFPVYIDDLRITPTEKYAQMAKSRGALESKSSNVWEVQASDLLQRARVILVDDKANAFDIAAALAVLCGRRMVEIFKTGTFETVARQPNTALFGGQVKSSNGSEHKYNIPLLAPLVQIKKALARLRELKSAKEMTNDEVNAKWCNSANSAASRLLQKKSKFHSLRMLYAVISFHATLPHTRSLNYHVSLVLGHSGLGNSLAYTCIHVTGLEDKDKFVWNMM